MKTSSRVAAAALAGVGGATLVYGGWFTRSWLRYGHATAASTPLLQRFLPEAEVREMTGIVVNAPSATTWRAVRELDLFGLPFARALFRTRALLLRSRAAEELHAPLLEQMQAIGWSLLAEKPGRELILGAAANPWSGNVTFRPLPPDEFVAFHEPGWVKIAWNVLIRPISSGRCIVRTETRVVTTDDESRHRFRLYWSLVSPGIVWIRREALNRIRREAERRKGTPESLTSTAPESTISEPRSTATSE